MRLAILSISLLAFAGCDTSTPRRSLHDSSLALSLTGEISNYQIGPTWGKQPLNQLYSTASEMTAKAKPSFTRAALATARVGRGTGFVLGERNGEVILATNHHVIDGQETCEMTSVNFELLDIHGLYCDKVIKTTSDLETTLFTVSGLNQESREKLLSVARSFSPEVPVKGRRLLTFGYGIANNPFGQRLMVGQDEHCITFSDQKRFMSDPDELNPFPYKTWAFATGCDVSHGDSGSAFIDAESGAIVGILYTGRIPKNPKVLDASYLKKIYDESSEEIWTELTYVVPSNLIVETLKEFLPTK
jgi:hypothetical protein